MLYETSVFMIRYMHNFINTLWFDSMNKTRSHNKIRVHKISKL